MIDNLIYGKVIDADVYADEEISERDIKNLVNDRNMSGIGGMSCFCGIDLTSMWLTKRDVEIISIIFDMKDIYNLGYMCIWNFNQTDGYLAGLKNIKLFTSTDGKNFTEFKGTQYPYVLACNNGKDKQRATNLNDGKNSPIDFNGKALRYIKVVADKSDGIWGKYIEGQIRFGLSKVRFFRHRNEPKPNAYAEANVINIENANVITSDYGLNDENSAIKESMYLSAVNDFNRDIIFDINMTATISTVEIYNYNVSKKLSLGLNNIELYYSLDGNSWNALGKKSYVVQMADGTKNNKPTIINFEPVYLRYVKLTVLGNSNTNKGQFNRRENRFGVAKVKFRFAKSGEYCEHARDWTSLLSNFEGWCGADGIFTAGIDGEEYKREAKERENYKTLVLFSDTFIGKINAITKEREVAHFVNNTMAYFNGLNPNTLTIDYVMNKDKQGNYINLLKNESKEFIYWMQDCIILNNKFYVFTDNIVTDADNESLPEGFRFYQIGVDLLSFDIIDGKIDYASQKIYKTPLFIKGKNQMFYGCGNLPNLKNRDNKNADGYIYLYGIKDNDDGTRGLLVSRFLPEDITDFDKYRFFNGKEFVKDINQSKPVCNELSPEMSVSYICEGKNKGKYRYVYIAGGVGDMLISRICDTPYSGFTDRKELFYTGRTEDLDYQTAKGIYQYNAKEHYHLGNKDETLISYNINCTDYESHLKNANVYRPRFVRYKEF